MGSISDYTDDLKEKGYKRSDTIGISGAEAAFEEYLRGSNGKRVTSVNSDGKITGEYYKVEPRSGYTVELTLDLDLQQSVEDTLAAKVEQLNKKDGLTSRGASACRPSRWAPGKSWPWPPAPPMTSPPIERTTMSWQPTLQAHFQPGHLPLPTLPAPP